METPHIEARDLTMAYGDFVLMHDLDFAVRRGSIFVIMGASGSGKSTLLRHLLGLKEPAKGDVLYDGKSFTNASGDDRIAMLRKFGVTYQGGALWTAMTLAENVSLPLEEYTDLSPTDIREVASLKLALVGLSGFEDYYPAEISGGMQKRAGLARAIALDPEILFFDEPSAGLDPITAAALDELILRLKQTFRMSIVVVTHELPSLMLIADHVVMLFGGRVAYEGSLGGLQACADQRVQDFLARRPAAESEDGAATLEALVGD